LYGIFTRELSAESAAGVTSRDDLQDDGRNDGLVIDAAGLLGLNKE
jgi:hypothetical protein